MHAFQVSFLFETDGQKETYCRQLFSQNKIYTLWLEMDINKPGTYDAWFIRFNIKSSQRANRCLVCLP